MIPSENADEPSNVDFVAELNGHTNTVNCVRFSPDGNYLASASDGTSIYLFYTKHMLY